MRRQRTEQGARICRRFREESSLETLGARASQRFAWHWESTLIAGRQRQLAVASDPEGMLIDACERQDAGEAGVIDPFGRRRGRAAAGLDRYLQRLELSSMRVLEIGCGTAHAGIAAAYRGARVTLTDGVTDPLLLVQMSVWPLRDRCHVRRLRFGIDRLNEPPFPLILGSDVTYLRGLWPQLNQCLQDHLCAGPHARVLLSDPTGSSPTSSEIGFEHEAGRTENTKSTSKMNRSIHSSHGIATRGLIVMFCSFKVTHSRPRDFGGANFGFDYSAMVRGDSKADVGLGALDPAKFNIRAPQARGRVQKRASASRPGLRNHSSQRPRLRRREPAR